MNFKIISILALFSLFNCGEANKDKKQTDQILQEIAFNEIVVFKDLPLSGAIQEGPILWSGDHWPMNRSSINYRWQTNEKDFNEYHIFNIEELKLMSEAEISTLSPSEKFDILKGDYNYTLFKEVANKNNIIALSWEGIGDGWAAATVFHEEPKPVTLTNKDNIVVSFGSSDIKALLSYYYSKYHKAAKEQIGLRCNSKQENAANDENCHNDLTASQFHQALSKMIGELGRPIIMDVDRYEQVWNHPILSYEATIINEGGPTENAPKETTQTIGIKNKVSYLDRSYNHAWNPVKETWNQVVTNRVYSYQLHLNEKGEIIGSHWVSHDRPDFLWIPQKVSTFSGNLDLLEELLKNN